MPTNPNNASAMRAGRDRSSADMIVPLPLGLARDRGRRRILYLQPAVGAAVPQEHVVHIRETVVQEQRRLYRWKNSVNSTVPPLAKLLHTMMDVAMMTLPVSVTIWLDRGSSSQRLAG